MHLSPVYQKTFWILVYHTQPGSAEVELVTNKLFESKAKADKWFARKHKPDDFIQPEAVMASGFDKLYVRRDLPKEYPTTETSSKGVQLHKPYDPLDGCDDPLDTY